MLNSRQAGRNDPCPCGSGRKFKQCCLPRVETEERVWKSQLEASRSLANQLMEFSDREFADQFPRAMVDFYVGNSGPNPKFDESQILFPYFLYQWSPEPRKDKEKFSPGAVAQFFLAKNANRLSPVERELLSEFLARPMSFYEAIEVWPEWGMRVRDVLTGAEDTVRERMGSTFLQPGDLFYAQLIKLQGVGTLNSMAPLPIPPKMKSDVVALRARLRKRLGRGEGPLQDGELRRFDREIRSTYLEIRNYLLTPPIVSNTDGELYELHELQYSIGSPQLAFDLLCNLGAGIEREEWLSHAKFDESGQLVSVDWEWLKRGNRKHKHWDNTILGNLRIDRRKLTVTVNSAERAARIKSEIAKRLGLAAVLVEDKIVDSNSKLRRRANRPKAQKPSPEPALTPEILEIAAESMRKFEDSWVRQKIPALGSMTPYQAAKDPDAREVLESLLLEMERSPKEHFIGGIRPNVERLRAKLKL